MDLGKTVDRYDKMGLFRFQERPHGTILVLLSGPACQPLAHVYWGIPAFSAPRLIFPRSRLFVKVNIRSWGFMPYILLVYVRISSMTESGIVIHRILFSVFGGSIVCIP